MDDVIRSVNGPEDLAMARGLLREYGQAFEKSAGFCFQSLESEVADLPGAYAPPRGRLLLACTSGEAAGCIALRPLADGTCEMKRLWVRPAHRGRGLGRRLVERLIAEARSLGYPRLRLDTLLEIMPEAVALYRAFGFVEIPPYLPVPAPGATCMELVL